MSLEYSFELVTLNKKIKKSNIIIQINDSTFSTYINNALFTRINNNINYNNFNNSLLELFKYYEYFISFENRIILEKNNNKYFNINLLYSDKESILYKINSLIYYRFIDLSNYINIVKEAKEYIICIQYINNKLIEVNNKDFKRLNIKSKEFVLKNINNKIWKYYSIKNYINNFQFQKKKCKIKMNKKLCIFSKKLNKITSIKLPSKQLQLLEKLFNDITLKRKLKYTTDLW